mgnify:CR=1 FL=1
MQDDSGFIYYGQDGTLMYTPALATVESFAHTQSFSFVAAAPPVVLWTDTLGRECSVGAPTGHEAAGPQATDARATSDALCDVLQGWATALVGETRGREVDNAISALHRQHTRDGRPSRFMQETE